MRSIRSGEKPYQQATDKKFQYMFLKIGEIVRVDEETLMCDVQWLDSPGGRTNIPISFAFANPRSYIGGMPTEGSIALFGFIQHSGFIGDPMIVAYLPRVPLLGLRGHEIEDKAFETSTRYKYRKLRKGETIQSSDQGSEVFLNEDIQIINSRLCEILLRSDDQNIIFSSLNNTVITEAGRIYTGNIIRNDRKSSIASYDANGNPLLVNGFLKPIVTPSGERLFIVTKELSANTIDEGGIPWNENRIEVVETGEKRQRVLDENIKEDIDTIVPIVSRVLGTTVGNDLSNSNYGKVYRPQIFTGFDSASASVADIPCASANEENKLAGCYELKFSNGTQIHIDKEGKFFAHFAKSSNSDPLGADRSIEFDASGGIKITIGRNKDQEESIRENRTGKTVEIFGRDDSFDQVSLDQNFSGKVKKVIGYNDTDKVSYDISAAGQIKCSVGADSVNQRSIDLDTSNGIKININNPDIDGNAINITANGKSVATITGDVIENYQDNQTSNIANTKTVNAKEIVLDGESGASSSIGGVIQSKCICPLSGISRESMGTPGSGFSATVKSSKD